MLRFSSVFISIASLVIAFGCSNSTSKGDGDDDDGSAASGGGSNSTGNGGSAAGINVNTGGSSAGSGTAGTGGGPSCAGETHEPENGPAVLQLVVDTSLSMDQAAPGGGGSKWVVTRDALAIALEQLSPQTSVGLMFYPNRGTAGNSDTPRDLSECVDVNGMVPIALLGEAGSPHRTALADALQMAGPDGSTPTHDAYKYALDNSISTTTQPGRRFMLLITDGVPTYALECVGSGQPADPSPTQPIIDEIAGAASSGVQTFIIGSPGSENDGMGGDARPWMSRGAIAGGTARAGCSEAAEPFCHFDMTTEPNFAEALSDALGEIAGAVVSCTYVIPTTGSGGQTVDRNLVNIRYTPGGGTEETILRSDDDPPVPRAGSTVRRTTSWCSVRTPARASRPTRRPRSRSSSAASGKPSRRNSRGPDSAGRRPFTDDAAAGFDATAVEVVPGAIGLQLGAVLVTSAEVAGHLVEVRSPGFPVRVAERFARDPPVLAALWVGACAAVVKADPAPLHETVHERVLRRRLDRDQMSGVGLAQRLGVLPGGVVGVRPVAVIFELLCALEHGAALDLTIVRAAVAGHVVAVVARLRVFSDAISAAWRSDAAAAACNTAAARAAAARYTAAARCGARAGAAAARRPAAAAHATAAAAHATAATAGGRYAAAATARSAPATAGVTARVAAEQIGVLGAATRAQQPRAEQHDGASHDHRKYELPSTHCTRSEPKRMRSGADFVAPCRRAAPGNVPAT